MNAETYLKNAEIAATRARAILLNLQRSVNVIDPCVTVEGSRITMEWNLQRKCATLEVTADGADWHVVDLDTPFANDREGTLEAHQLDQYLLSFLTEMYAHMVREAL